MGALTKQEQAQLKALIKNDYWSVLEKYVAAYTEGVNSQEIVGTNEFETLRMLHSNQGKVNGVEELLNLLETQAFKD